MSKENRAKTEHLFWELAAELMAENPDMAEGTIMNGRCVRVGKEFLALVDYKGSGLVVKLPPARVADLIDAGIGRPFAPAGRVFKEWVSVPEPNRELWGELLGEGVAFVAKPAMRKGRTRQ
ncbi:MAG TPA: hypothetical protein VF989_18590 [Polyangiaceae bacterium]